MSSLKCPDRRHELHDRSRNPLSSSKSSHVMSPSQGCLLPQPKVGSLPRQDGTCAPSEGNFGSSWVPDSPIDPKINSSPDLISPFLADERQIPPLCRRAARILPGQRAVEDICRSINPALASDFRNLHLRNALQGSEGSKGGGSPAAPCSRCYSTGNECKDCDDECCFLGAEPLRSRGRNLPLALIYLLVFW